MNDDRKIKGSKVINTIMENGSERLQKGLESIAPDLGKYVLEFIFGDLYSRDGLDLKMKQILTVTILATLGNAKPQLNYHINGALNLGVSRKDIVDILIHISGYAGFPAAMNGVATAKEVFAERDSKGIKN